MKTWFDEKRMEMLNSACEQVLSPQVQGPLSFVDVIQLSSLIESHNNDAVRRNSTVDLSYHNIDINEELTKAMVADAVAVFDNKTIGNFTWGAEKEHILDLAEVVEVTATKPAYVGDRLSIVTKKINKILNYFPDDDEKFIMASPMMISVFRSATDARFVQSTEPAFKGPNSIMLVGSVDGTPVYSYLPSTGTRDEDDLIILGTYQTSAESAMTQRLIVKNFSFV